MVDVPLNFEVINFTQKLAYDTAKENKDRLTREIKEMEQEIQKKREAIKGLEKIMKIEKYE